MYKIQKSKKKYKIKNPKKNNKNKNKKKCRPMHNGYSSCRTVSWGYLGNLFFYINPKVLRSCWGVYKCSIPMQQLRLHCSTKLSPHKVLIIRLGLDT